MPSERWCKSSWGFKARCDDREMLLPKEDDCIFATSLLASEITSGFEGVLFVDVGAYHGKWTLALYNVYDRAIAVEPIKENADVLEEYLKANDARGIEVVRKAAWCEDGTVKMNANAQWSSVAGDGIEVEAVTLDTLLADRLDKYKLIIVKVDVEGVELEVVKGAGKVIESGRAIFVIEHHEYWTGNTPMKHRNIAKIFVEADYLPFAMCDVHWAYVSRKFADKALAILLNRHVFHTVVLRNLREGRKWYHSVPGDWWHGCSILDFFYAIPEIVRGNRVKECELDKLYVESIHRLLGVEVSI